MPIISGGGGGGYTPPTAIQFVGGNNVNIANGGNDTLPWNTSFGPNVLLDRSTPTVPAVLTAGIYAVTVTLQSGAMTAAGTFHGSLELDSDNQDGQALMDSTPASAVLTTPEMFLTMTLYIPAAGTLRVKVRNHDGVNAVDFSLFAQVQKIT